MNMKYEIKYRSFIETLAETVTLYKDNFRTLFLISLLNSIPAVFMPHIAISNPENPKPGDLLLFIKTYLPWFILFVFVNTIANAIMTQFISQRYKDPATKAVRDAVKAIPFIIIPILGMSVLQNILVVVCFLPVVFQGLFPMLILAIYLILMLSLMPQVIIVERAGFIQSIKRSIFLTHGRKWQIFGYMMIFFVILVFSGSIGQAFGTTLEKAGANLALRLLVEHLVQVLVFPVNSCLFLLVYFNIRVQKENFHANNPVGL